MPDQTRAWGLLCTMALALGCGDDSSGPTGPASSPSPEPATGNATAAALSFRQVSAGVSHTCGVTTDDKAYCWGYNFSGQLGDGTTTQRTVPVAVRGGLRFLRVSAGSSHTCGLATTG